MTTTVKVSGVVFSTSLQGKDLKKARSAIASALAHSNERMGVLTSFQKPAPFAAYIAGLLLEQTPKFMLASAFHAAQRLPLAKRCTLEAVIDCGLLLPTERISDPVWVVGKEKPDGSMRSICAFNIRHRTVQMAVKRVLSAFYVPKAFQFTEAGVPQAIKAVQSAAMSGYRYAARLDISKFYQSFGQHALTDLIPLPERVVEYVVLGRRLTMATKVKGKPSLDTNPVILGARQGIPTGSICSPIVSSFAMSRLQRQKLGDVVLVNYADDFMLLAKSEAALSAAVVKLTAAVSALPGGNFDLAVKGTGHLADGIVFLGHHLRWQAETLTISVPDKGSLYFYKKLEELDEQLTWLPAKAETEAKIVASQLGFVHGWAKAYAKCHDCNEHVEAALATIKANADMLKLTMKQVGKLADHLGAKWHPDTSGMDI